MSEPVLLDAVEVRVLGSLIEKEATTPEYYPLSLNALVNACNQKSNREPVMELDEGDVRDALERLREKRLSVVISGGGRVLKYGQRISETLNLGRRELAVLGTLLLRGPQTLGELKDRSARAYAFSDLAETELVLDKLADWPGGGLAVKLARQPGQKEARYAHLLAGTPAIESGDEAAESGSRKPQPARLEEEIAELRAELRELKRRFDELEAQLR
jgi:uncharacterized protein